MAKSRDEIIADLKKMAARMRKAALDISIEVASKNPTHLGGGLSLMDITATLYGAVMKHDPKNPQWPDRDRFILSKGHGVLGYYPALAETGYITREEFMNFEQTGSFLLGHPVINRPKGIEFSNGSLGMGLGLGIGVALAGKKRNKSYRVFVAMGDGECNEGSVWEGAMGAVHLGLDNLVVIIDRNGLQQTGSNEVIMNTGNMAAKWASFGWNTVEVDGHDVGQLYDAFTTPNISGKPLAVIAKTVKGKGASFAENNNDWHHNTLTKAQYDIAVGELNLS